MCHPELKGQCVSVKAVQLHIISLVYNKTESLRDFAVIMSDGRIMNSKKDFICLLK